MHVLRSADDYKIEVFSGILFLGRIPMLQKLPLVRSIERRFCVFLGALILPESFLFPVLIRSPFIDYASFKQLLVLFED